MTYVISDVHGCYDKFTRLLETIRFSESDTLYILGDLVDRGEGGIKLMLDVMKRKNVICLVGNHDWTMASLLGNRRRIIEQIGKEQTLGLFELWFSDGGETTYKSFMALDAETQRTVLEYVSEMGFIKELTVNGNRFFMAHTVPEYDPSVPLTDRPAEDFIYGEPDYEIEYLPGTTIITGHTPTGLIDPAYHGRIWKGNGHIAIDCGAVFDGRLGCLRLEDLQEFYV